MVRPLLEIEKPWLTRDQMEAAIWRLTGIKNAVAVEQLLRLADVYAVSQGPALTARLKERDLTRDRWRIEIPVLTAGDVKKVQLRLAESHEDDELEPRSDGTGLDEPSEDDLWPEDRDFEFTPGNEWPGKPPKVTVAIWQLPSGRMFQRCSSCGLPKEYESGFHKDSARWNGISSQCKGCKNRNRTSYNRPPVRRAS